VAAWLSGKKCAGLDQRSYSTPDPVSTWIGDRLWAGKPSCYVACHRVYSAFYPPWDGKMSITGRAE